MRIERVRYAVCAVRAFSVLSVPLRYAVCAVRAFRYAVCPLRVLRYVSVLSIP